MMTEQLTMEEIDDLMTIVNKNDIEKRWLVGYGRSDARYESLVDLGYACCADCEGNDDMCEYQITDTGKRALATYKAQRDLVLFIAEFEEWLELEVKLQNEYEGVYEDDTFQGAGRAEQAENTLEKYRECKQRIEPHHDE